MKIEVIKPDMKHPDALRNQLITLQDNINDALGRLPFVAVERLSFQFRSAELPKLIAHHLPRPPWGLQPVSLRNRTDDTSYPSGWFLDWIPESGGIKIRAINGLTAGSLYEIELLAYC